MEKDNIVPFSEVLSLLEGCGWTLRGFWTPYRVFTKPNQLPILVEVHNKVVDVETVKEIKSILERELGGE